MSGSGAIDEFVSKVRGLHEVEYGDFKRKLGLYLMRLEEGLGQQSSEYVRQARQQIIFEHQGDIESSRRKALDIAERLRASGGHFTKKLQ